MTIRKIILFTILIIGSLTALAANPKIDITQVTVKTDVPNKNKKSIEVQVDYSEAGRGSGWVYFTLWFRDKENKYKQMKGTAKSREGYDCFRKSVFISKRDKNKHVNFVIPTEYLQLSPTEKTLNAVVTVEEDKTIADMSKKFLGSSYPFEVDFSRKYSYLYSSNPIIIPDPKPEPAPVAANSSSKTLAANSSSKTATVNKASTPAASTTTRTAASPKPATATPAKPVATVNKVWIEHNQTINGRTAMKVHCNFNVRDMKGKTGNMCVWIQDDNGNYIRIDNADKNSNGYSYVSHPFTPGYTNTDYNDYWRAVYVGDLGFKPGKHSYTACVTINDPNGKVLAQSSKVSFTGTGPEVARNNPAPSNSNRNSGSNVVKTWREEIGYGGFVICKQFQNGYIMRTRYRLCPNCRGAKSCASCYGRGVCAICSGRGGIVSAGYGNYYPCGMCGGTGRCNLCAGTGRCGCTKLDYPGYAIGSTTTIAPNGAVTRDNAEYNNYNSSRKSNSNSGRTPSGTCPNCHGDRVESNPMYENDPSGAGVQAVGQIGYTNHRGTKCRYCGKYSWHIHLKCYKCR